MNRRVATYENLRAYNARFRLAPERPLDRFVGANPSGAQSESAEQLGNCVGINVGNGQQSRDRRRCSDTGQLDHHDAHDIVDEGVAQKLFLALLTQYARFIPGVIPG